MRTGNWAPHYRREEDPSGRDRACEEASQFPGSLMVPFTRTAGGGREGSGRGRGRGAGRVTGSFGR